MPDSITSESSYSFCNASSTQKFLHQHPRWKSELGRISEYDGQQVIHFQIADMESSERLTVLAQRRTLRVLTLF
ncbi:MAG TPA: hypothetical protein DHV65_14940 [Ktedonobacter sp.]|nr:hypothetical protein [Ktedonobacter sp.]